MKKIWAVLVVILWGLAAVQALGITRQEEKEKIMQVLADVGTMEQSASVEYYGVFGEKEKSPASFLKEVAEALGMEEKLTLSRAEEEDRKEERLSSSKGKDSLDMRIVTLTEEGQEEQYFLLSLTADGEPVKTFEWREALDDLLSGKMEDVHSTTNIIGSYEGKLSLQERNRAADELLERMDVTVVEEKRSMDLYTICGYTPLLEEHVMQQGSPINLNLAMNYNEEEDRTYIYAAVPILSLDY